MAVNIPKYSGSLTFTSGSSTPLGLYDDDIQFQQQAPKYGDWIAQQLGFPIFDVELSNEQIYGCIEDAVSEYSHWVNTYNIRDNLFSSKGTFHTGSDFNNRYISDNLGVIMKIAKEYGSEVGSGGTVDVKRGYIDLVPDQQWYDLNTLFRDVNEPGKTIEIQKIYHNVAPASSRYMVPFGGVNSSLSQFGFAQYSVATSFVLLPLYADVLRMQQMEFNDQIRRSHFSFRLINNNLQIFPIPRLEKKLWFEYVILEDKNNPLKDNSGAITDYSDVPYSFKTFSYINDVGRQWIKKYALANAKEALGWVRSKYSSIPSADTDISLNGSDLVSAGQTDKQNLLDALKEQLEALTKHAQLQSRAEESDYLQQVLQKVPLKIWVG